MSELVVADSVCWIADIKAVFLFETDSTTGSEKH